jgi:cation:H+ antiporter
MDIFVFLASFVIILAGCEFFTNGVEWMGKRFCLSEGAVGSLLAAIGTALPETLIPLIAILIVGGEAGKEIGTGAILGAPFMLATLALLVCGLSVIAFRRRRGVGKLQINGQLVRRDLKFFLIAYGIAALAAFLPHEVWYLKYGAAVLLLPIYGYYSYQTLKAGGSQGEAEVDSLYLSRAVYRCTPRSLRRELAEPMTLSIIVQVIASLAAIILGSYMFVGQIQDIAIAIGIPALVLSLILCPIATELPEKFNSMLWIRERKDTFALGNITGAMVFQSCIPVTIGILLTEWHLSFGDKVQVLEMIAIGIALFSGALLYLRADKKDMSAPSLMIGGLLYLIFFGIVLLSI